MKGIHDAPKRSGLKAISWRIIATSTGMFLVYVFTGHLELTAGFGIGDIFLKMLFYFLHERAWNRISFGRTISGTIEEAIRSPPVKVLPSEKVSSVIEKMVASDIGAVVVVEDDKPCGLITEGDILKRVIKPSQKPARIFAKDIMSAPVRTTEYSSSLTETLKLMQNEKIRRLVVTHNGKVAGIITERRILEALV